MKDYLALIHFIMQLSDELNRAYHIHPEIRIIFGAADENAVGGSCATLYHRDDMYIEVNLPWKQSYTTAITGALTCLLIHEYAHYIWALKFTPAERTDDNQKYLNDTTFRRNDEYRTWTHTKKMLKDLGYWNSAIRKSCLTFSYSWAMKEK